VSGRHAAGGGNGLLSDGRVTAWLSDRERAHLLKVGTDETGEQPAGTYAKQILNRLPIDLSWNSSRLEVNTYSLLDTRRLIDFGEEAEGKERLEAQMILNHKDAIEFLVSSAQDIGFNRYTILNLHAMLANNLLADETAAGRLRRIAVGIERSVFHSLEVPSIIEECFDQLLRTAAAIDDPFEQGFFVMVQLPYLQPFDDVNKRVSRLAANIPLVKRNLSPLRLPKFRRRLHRHCVSPRPRLSRQPRCPSPPAEQSGNLRGSLPRGRTGSNAADAARAARRCASYCPADR
jgi:Fic family protein